MASPIHAVKVHQFGGPEVLKWEESAVGEPGPGEVRVRHHAIGLNFIDVYHRTGHYPLPLPLVPGVEAAGEIEAIGEGVSELEAGDRVAYAGARGSYTEARLIRADRLVRVPDELCLEVAAAVLLKGMTAYMLLRQVREVQAGDTILVHAAAGGTGLLLCQWAASLGATVIGTVSSDEKAELAHRHGCHHPIVTPEQDFVTEVERLTRGQKLPVVYDSVGQSTFLRSLDCLRPMGLMVNFGQSSGPVDPIAPVVLSEKGSLYLTRPIIFSYIPERHSLEAAASTVFKLVLNGTLTVEINQRFPLRDVARAHQALESRSTTGSTVLTL